MVVRKKFFNRIYFPEKKKANMTGFRMPEIIGNVIHEKYITVGRKIQFLTTCVRWLVKGEERM